MNLVVDVGNTETVMGLFTPESLDVMGHWRYTTPVLRTTDELTLLVRSLLAADGADAGRLDRAVIGSVVPRETELLRRTLTDLGVSEVHVLDGSDGLPIRLDVEEPRSVGADRIANTLAASYLFENDTVVVDLGTATTYDCIEADGTFLGGVIAPGVMAGPEWLAGRTAKLPRVEFRPPACVVGRRTETCLQSGIFFAAIDAIDGIVDRILAEWGGEGTNVVATGGHAGTVAAHSRMLGEVNPHLTLIGLELAGRHLSG